MSDDIAGAESSCALRAVWLSSALLWLALTLSLPEKHHEKRVERIVNAFAPGHVVAGSGETNDTVCILTEEFKKPQPDFPTLVKIASSFGIQIEAPGGS